jgi:hypothetical protein
MFGPVSVDCGDLLADDHWPAGVGTRFMSQTIFKTDGRTGNRYLRVRIPFESVNVEGQGHGFGQCRDDEYGSAWTGTRSTSSDRTLRLVSCCKPDSNSRTLPLTALESTLAKV